MQQNWQLPAEIKLVPVEPTPAKLFVFSAKIKPEAGVALTNTFDFGIGLPQDLETSYFKHIAYAYNLGKKNLIWEAGPAADFTEVYDVYAVDSLEEAQNYIKDDPLYKAGIFLMKKHLNGTCIPHLGKNRKLTRKEE